MKNKKFIITPSRQSIVNQLHDLLVLRDSRQKEALSLNDVQKCGGLGGLIIEGESGIGKKPAGAEYSQLKIKPGFMLLGTQNPIFLAGRQAASNALSRRYFHCDLTPYTKQEMLQILISKNLDSGIATSLINAYLAVRAQAQQKHLEQAPCFRDLLKQAEFIIEAIQKTHLFSHYGYGAKAVHQAGILTPTNEEILAKLIDYAQGLGRGFSALYQAGILTQANFDYLTKNPKNASKISVGLCALQQAGLMLKKYIILLMNNPQQAHHLGWGLYALQREGILERTEQLLFKCTPQHAPSLAWGLCVLYQKGILKPPYIEYLTNNAQHAQIISLGLGNLKLTNLLQDKYINLLLEEPQSACLLSLALNMLKRTNRLTDDNLKYALGLGIGLSYLRQGKILQDQYLGMLTANLQYARSLAVGLLSLHQAKILETQYIALLTENPQSARHCGRGLNMLKQTKRLTDDNLKHALNLGIGLYALSLSKIHTKKNVLELIKNLQYIVDIGNALKVLCKTKRLTQNTFTELMTHPEAARDFIQNLKPSPQHAPKSGYDLPLKDEIQRRSTSLKEKKPPRKTEEIQVKKKDPIQKKTMVKKKQILFLDQDNNTSLIKNNGSASNNTPVPVVTISIPKATPAKPQSSQPNPKLKRTRLSRISNKKLKELLKLPENVTVGAAYDNGGCFFDSLAQTLNRIQNVTTHTEKSLRMRCHAYYTDDEHLENAMKVDFWLQKIYGGIDKGKGAYNKVQFTQQELKEGEYVIWGTPQIDGRVLCQVLDLDAIYWIEIVEDDEGKLIPDFFKVTKDGPKNVAKQDFPKPGDSVPMLVIHRNHYVPILAVNNGKDLQAQPHIFSLEKPQQDSLKQPPEQKSNPVESQVQSKKRDNVSRKRKNGEDDGVKKDNEEWTVSKKRKLSDGTAIDYTPSNFSRRKDVFLPSRNDLVSGRAPSQKKPETNQPSSLLPKPLTPLEAQLEREGVSFFTPRPFSRQQYEAAERYHNAVKPLIQQEYEAEVPHHVSVKLLQKSWQEESRYKARALQKRARENKEAQGELPINGERKRKRENQEDVNTKETIPTKKRRKLDLFPEIPGSSVPPATQHSPNGQGSSHSAPILPLQVATPPPPPPQSRNQPRRL